MFVFDTNIRLYSLSDSTTGNIRSQPYEAPRVNIASGNRAAFRLKQLLKSAGWTVTRSSDGTSFGAGDLIAHDGMGAGGMCNDLAWFVVRQPVGGRELCFQGTNYGTPGYEMSDWRLKYSFADGFTSGESATETPDTGDGDEQFILGGGDDASPFFTTWCRTQDQNGWCHIAADNAAPYGFYVAGYSTTSNGPIVGLAFDPLVAGSYQTGDPDPYVFYASQDGGVWQNEIEQTNSYAWIDKNGGGETWSTLGGLRYGGFPQISQRKNANPFNRKFDRMPLIWVDYENTGQIKGQSSLMYRTNYSNALMPSGKTFQRTTPHDTILAGGIFLPWNGTLPNR